MPTGKLKLLVVMVFVSFFVFPIPPSHAVLDLTASLSVSEQYTDNLFFTFANKQDDFGTFVTPRFTLTFRNKYIELGGTYAANGRFYVNNTQANTFANGTNFNIDLPFLNRISKRLHVRINESLNFTPEQPGFSGNSSRFLRGGGGSTGFGGGGAGAAAAGAGGAGVGGLGSIGGLAGNSLNNGGIFTRRTSSIQNRGRIGVIYHFNPRWDGNIQYSNTLRRFSSSQLQDSITHAIQPGLSFQFSDTTSLSADYRLRFTEFSGNNNSSSNPQAPGGGGSSTSQSLNFGVDHQWQPTIPIQVSVGATVSKTRVGTTRLNFTGGGSIYKLVPDGEIGLRVNQQIGSGGGVAASTTIRQRVVLTASKSFTRLINGFLQFGYSRNRSLAGRAIATDTYQFRGGVNYMLLEWLSAGVTYSYRNQDSSGQFGRTAQSNSIFLGLTAITPNPIKFFK